MAELDCHDYAVVRLDVGYRCPPGVVALARAVRGDAPPGAPGAPGSRRGADATYAAFEDETALAERLGRDLPPLLGHDGRASVAVLCRSALTARRLAASLRAHVPTRLVFDGRFLPRGAVQVTTVDEVKGLEFDYVVVPDATASEYPETPSARRALYLAITRARFQVILAAVGERTPLVAAAPWAMLSA
jgi:DNA helicase IV